MMTTFGSYLLLTYTLLMSAARSQDVAVLTQISGQPQVYDILSMTFDVHPSSHDIVIGGQQDAFLSNGAFLYYVDGRTSDIKFYFEITSFTDGIEVVKFSTTGQLVYGLALCTTDAGDQQSYLFKVDVRNPHSIDKLHYITISSGEESYSTVLMAQSPSDQNQFWWVVDTGFAGIKFGDNGGNT